MAIKLGNNSIGNAKLGTTQVKKIYLGTNEIWPATNPGSCDFFGDGTGKMYLTLNDTYGDSCNSLSIDYTNDIMFVWAVVNKGVRDVSKNSQLVYTSTDTKALHFNMPINLTMSFWFHAGDVFEGSYWNKATAVNIYPASSSCGDQYTPWIIYNEYKKSSSTYLSDTFYDISIDDSNPIQISPTNLSSSWHHICYTRRSSSNTIYCYFDGSLYTTFTVTNDSCTGTHMYYFYMHGETVQHYFDNFRMMTRFCTAHDVQLLYQER